MIKKVKQASQSKCANCLLLAAKRCFCPVQRFIINHKKAEFWCKLSSIDGRQGIVSKKCFIFCNDVSRKGRGSPPLFFIVSSLFPPLRLSPAVVRTSAAAAAAKTHFPPLLLLRPLRGGGGGRRGCSVLLPSSLPP